MSFGESSSRNHQVVNQVTRVTLRLYRDWSVCSFEMPVADDDNTHIVMLLPV